ncbi:hypothetical protein KQI84_09205 [bacterium]|nr:hypothetical protein [bacterium]
MIRMRGGMIGALALAPGAVWACGVCTQSLAQYHIPGILGVFYTFVAWKIVHTVLLWMGKLPILEEPFGRVIRLGSRAGLIVLAIVLFPMTGYIGLLAIFIYLFVMFAVSLVQDRAKEGRWHRGGIAMLASVLIVSMSIVVIDAARRTQMTPLDKYFAYVSPGSGPARSLAQDLARGPVDHERLRIAFERGGDERSLAIDVLREHSNRNDLLLFRDAISLLPDEMLDASSSIMDAYKFQYWLNQFDVPWEKMESIDELLVWIDTNVEQTP